MERPSWALVRAIVLAVTSLFLLPLQAQAERDWEFSVSAFGGKAFHSNENLKISQGPIFDGGGMVIGTFTNGIAQGVNLNDAPTFGGKITAWNLPRKYKWQPQIGLELDWTRFTADIHPQTVGAEGAVSVPGFELGSLSLIAQDFSVNVLAVNLLFRSPIGATQEMPQGRWYPYVGGGLGAQRASLTLLGYQETSYAPAVQGLVGIKFFLIKNLAIFGEVKRTTGKNEFDFEGAGAPPGYFEKYSITSNHFVGGVALHF